MLKHFISYLKLNMSKKRKHSDVTDTSLPEPKRHWAQGLLYSMKNPEYLVQSDNLTVVIKDKFPKAEYHYLVLPKEHISTLRDLTEKDVSLLKHMHKVAQELISDSKHKDKNFFIGYHAQASMVQLHLHILSDDMNSPALKTKKHWNSYTTKFFLKSEDVCKELEKNCKISLPLKEECKKLLSAPLKCHKCDYQPKNIPDLKKHILIHL